MTKPASTTDGDRHLTNWRDEIDSTALYVADALDRRHQESRRGRR